MNDIYVTLVGLVVAEPRLHTLTDGSRVASLRVGTTSRYFDRKHQEWRDGDRMFFTVRCWRGLADNVAQSLRVGHPVMVQGRLRIREYERDGERRFIAEVEATSVGHDLRWGVGSFTRPPRVGSAPAVLDAETRHALDTATADWSLPSGRALAQTPASPAPRPGTPAEAPQPGTPADSLKAPATSSPPPDQPPTPPSPSPAPSPDASASPSGPAVVLSGVTATTSSREPATRARRRASTPSRPGVPPTGERTAA